MVTIESIQKRKVRGKLLFLKVGENQRVNIEVHYFLGSSKYKKDLCLIET